MKENVLRIGGGVVIILFVLSVIYNLKLNDFLPKPQSSSGATVTSPTQISLIDETPANLKLAPGFSMTILAEKLENPRTMMIGTNGNLWVTLTSEGEIVEIVDSDGNGKSDRVNTLVAGLDNPHGLEKRCVGEVCDIFIAETKRLSRYEYRSNLKALVFKEKLADLPAGGRHFTRSLVFLPGSDYNKLLVSIGSSCDVCHEVNDKYGTIQVFDLKTKKLELYAKGLRNAVFMTLHPMTGKIWVTEMGRDFLGDELPPDELNVLQKDGNFGWPNCYGQNIHDSVFDKNTYIRNPCMEPFEIPSTIDLPAHSAPLGLAFIPKEGWPPAFQGDLLVSYHGSWNRSEPTGYKVMRYDFDADGKLLGMEDFLTGFLDNSGGVSGRPAGILALPNGKVYLSDDKSGKIYQINYLK